MAKTVKFNLVCDGNSVRTIDELKNNFSIEDILYYYENKILHKWLTVRGYEDYLKSVERIKSEEPIEIITELIMIFEVETDKNKIEESIYSLKLKKEKYDLLDSYIHEDKDNNIVINNFYAGYNKLIDRVLVNSNNISIIKSTISTLINNYFWLLKVDHRKVFYMFLHRAPIAIFVFLMYNETRTLFLPKLVKDKDGNNILDVNQIYQESDKAFFMKDKKKMNKDLIKLASRSKEILGDYLKSFSKFNSENWQEIEPGGKRFMIINMMEGSFIRSSKQKDIELTNQNVENCFPILDGIEYKSDNYFEIHYMEV